MTKRMILRRRWMLPAFLLAVLLLPTPAVQADTLPKGVVAIVGGKRLTFEGFCTAAAQQARMDLRQSRSGPRSVLEQLIEEELVRQECRRLGLSVSQAEVNARWSKIDRRLRMDSNGARTLRDVIREQRMTEREFIEQLWHILRKERIAVQPQYLGKTLPDHEATRLRQVGIVIATVRKKTIVKYGVETREHVDARLKPDPLPRGQVATVNGVPITEQAFGRALVLRLPGDKVREYLDRECKTALMTLQGVKLSDAELDQEIDHLRKLWPLERELQREEIWRTVSFKDRFGTQFGMSEEEVRKSRYSRGLLGLVRSQRAKVTEEEVRTVFDMEKQGRYGAHILVTDVKISFAQKKALLGDRLRSLREALALARNVARRQAEGTPFEKIVADINAKRDSTFRGQRIRLYSTDRDRVLYNQAARMRDGDVSSPFETLAEVHVLRREGMRPARTLPEVRPHVRELIARRKARQWIEERIRDPQYVRIAWPIPERGGL